jgi:hypothetical protein
MFPKQDINAFTCIEERVDVVHALIDDILNKREPSMNWSLTPADKGSLLTTINRLNKRMDKAARFVIWEPAYKKGSTVFFSNFQDGWFTLMNIISIVDKRRAYQFHVDDEKNKTKIGFYYNYGEEEQRVVRILFGDKWEFFERGDALPFEDTDRYTKHFRTDRMNKELIKSYLRKLGWDIDHEDFYRTEKPIVLGRE